MIPLLHTVHLQQTADSFSVRTIAPTLGKIEVIVDRAQPPHCAKLLKALLTENKEIKIIYLPKGLPHLNAVEECSHRTKQASCLKTLQESRICGTAYLNISERPDTPWASRSILPENSNTS